MSPPFREVMDEGNPPMPNISCKRHKANQSDAFEAHGFTSDTSMNCFMSPTQGGKEATRMPDKATLDFQAAEMSGEPLQDFLKKKRARKGCERNQKKKLLMIG